jgi:subtilisin family serine protease
MQHMKLLKWVLFLVLFCSINNSISAQNCHPDDSIALMDLRTQLNLSSFLPGPIATWAPTYLDTIPDPAGGNQFRITGINFSNLNPTGFTTLPDSLFFENRLSLVEFLFVDTNSINSLEGALRPDTAGTIPSLKHLNISSNDFASGDFLFFINLIDNMDSLETLNANAIFLPPATNFSNYLLSSAPQLIHLDIQNNGFTGTLNLLMYISFFQNLSTIKASSNNFNTLVPPGGGVLKNIYLNDLKLTDFKPIETLVNNCPLIEVLKVHSVMDTVNYQDTIEFNITNTPTNLYYLDLSYNRLVGNFPPHLVEALDSIEYLYVNNNQLSGQLPAATFTMNLPAPFNVSGKVYEGLALIKELDISNNQLNGDLRLDHLFAKQLVAFRVPNAGLTMPLQKFYAQGNQFREIKPILDNPIINGVLSVAFAERFTNLKSLSFSNNRLGFKDLFRAKKFFRLKHINPSGVQAHYVPQGEGNNNPGAFQYGPQADLGIGGVRRKIPAKRITLQAGAGIEARETGGVVNYIMNNYKWIRIDTNGGSFNVDTLGFSSINEGSMSFSPTTNNTGYIADINLTYLIGIDTQSVNMHRMGIDNLDSAGHASRLYQAIVSNDSFPLLTLKTVGKKVEVGSCSDDSDGAVWCQSMIVQFHPDTLALYSAAGQDSLKLAIRSQMGAVPLEVCLCGDIELWGISDTASSMLEAFGKGTKQSTTKVSARPQLLSADPNYNLLPGTSNTLPNTVNLPSGVGNTTATTLVAIIDSGVDYEYTALVPYLSEGPSSVSACMPNATWGFSFLDDSNNATDDHGHGTAVAGIVAGISQQSILPATASTARDIGILPLKYTGKNASGSLFNAACALRYAADYQRTTSNGAIAKVRVINTSWGYYGDPCMVLENVLQYVGEDCGILVVASAGNDGIAVEGTDDVRHWPSNSIFDPLGNLGIDNVLAVAGLHQTLDSLNDNSNYGSVHIDVAAPWNDNSTLAGSDSLFAPVEGTSFAAPQVARAAALLFDKYPSATYWAVKYAIINGVDVLQHSDSMRISSGGSINFHKADSILNIITNRTICTPSITINVEQIEGLEDYVRVYPNPVSDNLIVELDYTLNAERINLSLYGVQGQLLHYQELPTGTTTANIPMKELPGGIYFMQLQLDNKQYSTKVIKL